VGSIRKRAEPKAVAKPAPAQETCPVGGLLPVSAYLTVPHRAATGEADDGAMSLLHNVFLFNGGATQQVPPTEEGGEQTRKRDMHHAGGDRSTDAAGGTVVSEVLRMHGEGLPYGTPLNVAWHWLRISTWRPSLLRVSARWVAAITGVVTR
jgi:hypothetical protein